MWSCGSWRAAWTWRSRHCRHAPRRPQARVEPCGIWRGWRRQSPPKIQTETRNHINRSVFSKKKKHPHWPRSSEKWNYWSISKIDTYGLFHLTFVGEDLGLEFLNELLEAFLVLFVLVSLEGELFEAAVSLASVLLGLGVTALFAVQLALEFSHLRYTVNIIVSFTDLQFPKILAYRNAC